MSGTLGQPRLKHGHRLKNWISPTYRSWRCMLGRCDSPGVDSYAAYGGRGISVCTRWRSFVHFLEDMGERPTGTTLGRLNHALDYCKSNCRWETVEQQQNSRRDNRFVTVGQQTLTLEQWARLTGIGRTTIAARLGSGWNPAKAVTAPIDTTRRPKRHTIDEAISAVVNGAK